MHDLEQLIAQWRERASIASDVPAETLDELESHLRETAEESVRSGLAEPEAFRLAVERLGMLPAIQSEFRKLDQPVWLAIKVAIGLVVMTAMVLAAFLIARFNPARSGFLLACHVFTVTLGYTTTLLVGGLGICFIGQRCHAELPPSRVRSLNRATFMLGCFAAGLTVAGVVLGMLWAKAEWGRYWAWDAKEVGGSGVVLWLACFLFAHRFAGNGARGVPVMGVLGSIVVGLAWFGTNPGDGLLRYGTSNVSLLLVSAVVLNLALFAIGMAPAGWLRFRRT